MLKRIQIIFFLLFPSCSNNEDNNLSWVNILMPNQQNTQSHTYVYNFEDGYFESEWDFDGFASWFVTSEQASESTFSARSGYISDDMYTDLILTIQATPNHSLILKFDKFISSEQCCDHLRLYINGSLHESWSGTSDEWTNEVIPYDVGSSNSIELKWRYVKDGSVTTGSDCVYIDNIEIEV